MNETLCCVRLLPFTSCVPVTPKDCATPKYCNKLIMETTKLECLGQVIKKNNMTTILVSKQKTRNIIMSSCYFLQMTISF